MNKTTATEIAMGVLTIALGIIAANWLSSQIAKWRAKAA
jgi:hypothetical protein